MNLKALHILTTDVQNKIHLGLQIMSRIKMSHGLYNAIVHAEGMANQILAVACHSTS